MNYHRITVSLWRGGARRCFFDMNMVEYGRKTTYMVENGRQYRCGVWALAPASSDGVTMLSIREDAVNIQLIGRLWYG